MISTLALALALQAPPTMPRDAELIYPVMPEVKALGGVSMTQSIHSVTATLGKTDVTYEVLSLYKNTSNVDGNVVVVLPFESWRHGFGKQISVSTQWADQTVSPFKSLAVQPLPEKGQLGRYTVAYRLPVKKGATYSLRSKYTLPIGKSGVDREERLVGYKVTDIGPAALDQFRMAVKYTPAIVFAPIDQQPAWGWEVGADGAYLKLDGKPSNRSSVLVYRYYPPTL